MVPENIRRLAKKDPDKKGSGRRSRRISRKIQKKEKRRNKEAKQKFKIRIRRMKNENILN